MNTRHALLAVALVFGIWETTDIVDTGVPAAVFAVLYLACSLWLYRKGSVIAAGVIAVLCTFEATQAHTWKDAGTFSKTAAEALGTLGVLVAVAFVVQTVRARPRLSKELP